MNEQDILNQLNDIDLSTVETSFPLLASGIVSTTIVRCEFRRDTETKGDSANPYLYVEYTLTSPWKTVEHDGIVSVPVNPGARGSTFNERIYIGKYIDKKTAEEKWYGLERCAQLREAVFGKATAGSKFDPAELINQPCTVKLLFEPAPVNKDTKEVYGPRTSVRGYVRAKN